MTANTIAERLQRRADGRPVEEQKAPLAIELKQTRWPLAKALAITAAVLLLLMFAVPLTAITTNHLFDKPTKQQRNHEQPTRPAR